MGCVTAMAPGIGGSCTDDADPPLPLPPPATADLLEVTVVHWSSSSSAGIASHSPSASNTVSTEREKAELPDEPPEAAAAFFFLAAFFLLLA